MLNRFVALAAIVVVSSAATPFVVRAAGGPAPDAVVAPILAPTLAPSDRAVAAPLAPTPRAATPEVAALRQPALGCARRVRVVYPGIVPDPVACAVAQR